MIILGIDPGSITLGYGLIEKNGNSLKHIENGAIYMKKELLSKKLKIIYKKLSDIIIMYKPNIMSIENVFYGKNVKATVKLSHARAIAVLLSSLYEIPAYEFSPLEVKKSVVGYGRAEKSQIQNMVRLLLNLPEIADEDASDALALAITYANTSNFSVKNHII